jgi:nucleotide-binding universal stress UspA family protein
MFKSILVAVDGSDYSRQAVPAAIEVAKKFGSEVFVLHVHEHDLGRAAVYPVESDDQAAEIVAEAIATIRGAGVSAEGEVRVAFLGQVADEIVETAALRGANLIVMGSRGLSDVAGLFLGSVTHKVLRLAHVAVLIDRTAPIVESVPAAASSNAFA